MNEALDAPEVDPAAMAAAADAALLKQEEEAKAIAQCKEHIKRLRRALEQQRRHDEKSRERYADDRRVARGETQWKVDTNLVQTIIEILMAFIYAKDPDISATVSPSVGDSRAKDYADMTSTLEIVVSRLLKDAGLKRKAKRWVRSAMTVGTGWLRAGVQTQVRQDPLVQNEINDLQQQLRDIAAIKASLAEGACGDVDAKESELNAKMLALQANLERRVAVGFTLDVYQPEDVGVSPECGELENYLDAPWISVRLYKSFDEVKGLTGWSDADLKPANRYHQRPRKPDEQNAAPGGASGHDWIKVTDESAESIEGFLLVEEIQHKRDGVIYTLVEGIDDKWARAPYPPRQSSRFYDLFLLGFHFIDGDRHPQSDVHMLKRLQDEYGRTRSNFAEHRKRAIPATIFDASKIDATEAKKLTEHDIGEYVGLNVGDTEDMRTLFAPKSYAQFDPNLYNTQPILQDIEKVSGAQDAMQSGVTIEKTATEAEIQNNGFGARVGTRKDAIEDVLSELALHCTQLAMQTLDEDFVRMIAGDNAIWPQLTVDEVLYGFNIEVKAGSTGKPNTAARQRAWQTILPLVEKMITVIGNFRAQGPQMEWAAAPYVALLKETVHRLDDRFDIDKLLPAPPPPQPAIDPVTGQPTLAPPGGAQPPGAAPPMNPVLAGGGGDAPALPAPATP